MTPDEVRAVRLRTSFWRAYLPADVDGLLSRVAIQMEAGQSPRDTIERQVLRTGRWGYHIEEVDHLLEALKEGNSSTLPKGSATTAPSRTGDATLGTLDGEPHGSPRHLAVWYAVPYVVVVTLSWIAFGLKWESVLTATTAWDGQHFLAIAEHNYPTVLANGYSNLAFFPGMPVAIRLVHLVGPSWRLAGFVVSIIAGGAFCVTGGLMVARRYGDRAGLRAATLLAVAPGAFLFGLSYADPLAIALVAGTLLALDSKRWDYAGALGGLATAASPFGLPVVLAGVWTAYRSGGRAWAAAAAMPLGFIVFMLGLWDRTGVARVWFKAQAQGWGQGFSVLNSWDRINRSGGIGIPVTVGACIALAAVGIYFMYRARVPVTWWLYTIPVVCVGLFGEGSWMNPRILLNAFPLTLAAAVNIRRGWFVGVAVLSLAAMQLALVAYLVVWPNIVAQP